MQKTLMILGAGAHQHSTIQKAVDMGLKVVAIDKDKDAVGFNIRSNNLEKINISIKDKESILEIAQIYGIDGIMSPCADAGILTTGYINDCMKLKGPSLASTVLSHDKELMYTYLTSYTNIKMPQRYAPYPIGDEGFPVISKPITGVGSKDVYKFESIWDFNRDFDFMNSSNLVVEEYIKGDIFSATLIMQNGKPVYYFVLDQTLSDHNFGTCMFSSKKGPIGDILVESFRTVQALGIRDGAVEVEGIICNNDIVRDIYIIDVNPRMAGGFIFDAKSYASDIDWTEKAIQAALGEFIHVIPHTSKPFVIVYKGSDKEGVFSRRTDKYKQLEPEHEKRFMKFIGSKVKPCNTKETSSEQFIVAIYTTGNTEQEAYNKAQIVYNGLDLEVIPDEELTNDRSQ